MRRSPSPPNHQTNKPRGDSIGTAAELRVPFSRQSRNTFVTRARGLLSAPIEPLPHLFSRLEMGVSLFLNWDQRAGPGITASSSFMDFDRKRPEAAQLDPLTARQRSGNSVE
jgi:hypothetical protein